MVVRPAAVTRTLDGLDHRGGARGRCGAGRRVALVRRSRHLEPLGPQRGMGAGRWTAGAGWDGRRARELRHRLPLPDPEAGARSCSGTGGEARRPRDRQRLRGRAQHRRVTRPPRVRGVRAARDADEVDRAAGLIDGSWPRGSEAVIAMAKDPPRRVLADAGAGLAIRARLARHRPPPARGRESQAPAERRRP